MRLTRITRTFVVLEISPAAYREIAGLLADAGYNHVFREDAKGNPLLDMQGIALGLYRRERETGTLSTEETNRETNSPELSGEDPPYNPTDPLTINIETFLRPETPR